MSTLRFGASMSSVKHAVKLSAGDLLRDRRGADVGALRARLRDAQRERRRLVEGMRATVWFRLLPVHILVSISVQVAVMVLLAPRCT